LASFRRGRIVPLPPAYSLSFSLSKVPGSHFLPRPSLYFHSRGSFTLSSLDGFSGRPPTRWTRNAKCDIFPSFYRAAAASRGRHQAFHKDGRLRCALERCHAGRQGLGDLRQNSGALLPPSAARDFAKQPPPHFLQTFFLFHITAQQALAMRDQHRNVQVRSEENKA
jgi:hypothetical protein